MQLTENVLNYKITFTGAGEEYIDLFYGLSAMNRKLIRQNQLLTVLQVNVYSTSSTAIMISGAPRNYVTRNSLIKAYHLWRSQQKKGIAAVGDDIRPGWSDFKVFLNEAHRLKQAASGDHLPVSGDAIQTAAGSWFVDGGDWIRSQIVWEQVEAGSVVEKEPVMHILGDDNGTISVGLIHQYGLSRRLPPADGVPSIPGNIEHSMYVQAAGDIDAQTEEIITNMEGANDDPPYSNTTYPGTDTNLSEPYQYSFGSFSAVGDVGRKISMAGFTVPNGLVHVRGNEDGPMHIQFVIGGWRKY